jgi:hypothetical protein
MQKIVAGQGTHNRAWARCHLLRETNPFGWVALSAIHTALPTLLLLLPAQNNMCEADYGLQRLSASLSLPGLQRLRYAKEHWKGRDTRQPVSRESVFLHGSKSCSECSSRLAWNHSRFQSPWCSPAQAGPAGKQGWGLAIVTSPGHSLSIQRNFFFIYFKHF